MTDVLNAETLLDLYRAGVFPMANDRDSHWIEIIDPVERGVLPLDKFHIPKSLKKSLRRHPFEVKVNTAFAQTIEACSEPGPGRESTWINDGIINLYCTLNQRGFAHSVECWAGNRLVGGLYGVSLGGVFFGESMFSRATNASKIALVHLAAGLLQNGFTLLDAQFHNPHLEQFGLETITRDEFQARLKHALESRTQFSAGMVPTSGIAALQLITQTS